MKNEDKSLIDVENVMYIIPMYLRLKTFTKTLPQMSFHQLCFTHSVTLLTAGALTDPQLPTTASNVCTTEAV